jgi:hypothetical protein
MVNPLLEDGSNFPCKKYEPSAPVATFRAGDTVSIKFDGSAIHDGGHCQFSISYNDVDFVSVFTVLNDCFVVSGYTLPSYIPSKSLPPFSLCL